MPRFRTLIIVASAALTAAVLVAPPAAAVTSGTSASCPVGLIVTPDSNLIPSPATVHFTQGCPGFTDDGTPYVFDVAALTVDPIGVDPGPFTARTYDNVVETCTSVATSSAGLEGVNCTD